MLTGRAGIDALLSRACDRAAELGAAAEEYLRGEAISWAREEGGIRLSMAEDPPDEWAFLLRDASHDARCALDHLAWRLVEVDGGEPNEHTAFPVRESETGLGADLRNRMRGASSQHKSAVKALEPHRQGSHGIWLISAVDNAYKHRMLMPVLVRNTGMSETIGGELFGGKHVAPVMTIFIPSADNSVETVSDGYFVPDSQFRESVEQLDIGSVFTSHQPRLVLSIDVTPGPGIVPLSEILQAIVGLPAVVEHLVADSS